MEKVTKDVFQKWMQKNNWLKVNEAATPNGRQGTFVTPAGNFVAAIYALNGDLVQLAMLGPAPQAPPPGFLKGLPFVGGKG